MDGIRWLPEDCDAYCLLLVRGLTVDELVDRLGYDPQAVMPSVTSDEAFEQSMGKAPVARLGVSGDWAFSLEQWSAEGMEPGRHAGSRWERSPSPCSTVACLPCGSCTQWMGR